MKQMYTWKNETNVHLMMEKSTPNATSTVDGIGPRINEMDRSTLKQNTNSISTKRNSILTKYKLDLNRPQSFPGTAASPRVIYFESPWRGQKYFSAKTRGWHQEHGYRGRKGNMIGVRSYSSLIDFFLMLIGVLCLLNFSGGDFLEEVGGLSFRIGMLFAWGEMWF